MNPKPTTCRLFRAFTLLELFVVVIIIAIVFAMALPTYSGKAKAQRHQCLSNLRQISLGLLIWSSSNSNLFPWEVATNLGGSMEFNTTGTPADHFQTISNLLPVANIWCCPADRERKVAPPNQPLSSSNLSYFISLDATLKFPNSSKLILTGDRHLTYNGQPVKPGLLVITNFATLAWQKGFHGPDSDPQGVIAFVDGHVETVRSSRLPGVFQAQGFTTNRIVVP